VLAMLTAMVLLAGFGNVGSSVALHGKRMLALDLGLLSAAAYCVVHATGILRSLDALPWRAGMYLFPACVVDARGPILNVWPVGDAEAIECVSSPEPALALRMRDGSRVVVPAPSLEIAQRAEAVLASKRDELARAIAEENPHVLAELDPLHDNAMSSPIGPTEPMKRAFLLSVRFDWAIAAVVGGVVGLALATTRNAMSDDAMYRSILASASAPAYRAYLAQGGKRSDEVRDVLLPRAELADAVEEGTAEALQAFALAHPSSKIGSELDVAIHRAMLVELDKAKKVGTVAALDAFAHKFPEHHVDAQLKAARHAIYAQSLAAWKKKSQEDAPTVAFVERLLAWAEKNSPACEVRFRMRPSKTLEDADKAVMKSDHYPGPDALPSKYVSAEAISPREQRVADSVTQGFAAAFPSDVLSMRAGEPLGPDAPLPTDTPALVVEYSPEWSRGTSVSTKPLTVFVGFIFQFEVTFVVPDGAPLKLSMKAWRAAEAWKIKAEGLSREEFEQKVYDSLIDGAFDQLDKKLADVFFQ
jgi:hypothetical protein